MTEPPVLLGFPDEVAQRRWTGPDLDVHVATYEHAVALPLRRGGASGQRMLGCVYDRGGRVVVDSERAKANRAWAGNPTRLPADLAVGAQRLAGRGYFAGHRRAAFGHFLLEVMPRLWPDLDYGSYEHVVLYPTKVGERLGRLEQYETDLLDALGIDPARIVLVDRPLVLDEITIATPAFALKRAVDPMFVRPFDRSRARVLTADPDPRTPRRIYLSRRRLRTTLRRAANEAEIEALLDPLGFTVVHPQEMSIKSQIAAVRGADVVAGCDGSALHLSAFARPGTTLLSLDSRVVENQLMIDVVRGLAAVHVLAPVGGPIRRDESWQADLDLVRHALSVAGVN